MTKRTIFPLMLAGASIVLVSSNIATTRPKYVPVHHAVASGMVAATVRGEGLYQQECISMVLTSMVTDTVYVNLEPGLRLPSDDTTIQNILIVRNDSVKIAPRDSIRLLAYGFCCQAHKGAPYKGSRYSVGRPADARLQQIATYLSSMKHEVGAMQSAIWAISDNYSIASITEADSHKQQVLREQVAKIMGRPTPWYTVTFKKDTSLSSGVPEFLVAQLKYQVTNNAFVDLLLTDERGTPVKVFFRYTPHNPDRYTYDIKLDVSSMPRGKYFVKMFYDGVLKQNNLVEL